VRLRAVRALSVKTGPDMHCCCSSWPITNVPALLLHSRSLAMRTKLGDQQYTVVYRVLQASVSCTSGGSSCTILVWELHRVSVCARIMYQTWQQACKNRARCGAEFLHLAAQPSFQFYKREAGPESGRRVTKIRVKGAMSAHTDNATASFHSPPVMGSVAARDTEGIQPFSQRSRTPTVAK